MRPSAALIAVALAAGCSDGAPAAPPVDAQTADAPTDAADADATADATAAEWTGPFPLDFHYSGLSEPVGGYERAEVTGNVGDLTLDGVARPALVAQTVDWSSAGYQLVHLYATDADDLRVAFIYCRNGQTAGVYLEGLTTSIQYFDDVTRHPCEVRAMQHTVTARLRPFRGLPEGFEPVVRATITGPGISLDAQGVGRITLGGADWDLTPYSWVDCTVALCGAPGWYEVHSLLRGPDGATGSVILYLMRDAPAQVRTSYGLRFDAPGPLPNTMFAAAWTLL
ncbi:MAG: hypothetical protein Q8S73_10965 [Deltaproteobacteria bacterium]|nr:hypothetical protein [Myxococcales bacterium]MDP3214616.1 hypothetical protein [Deltaproteobacteria bacterium]